MGFLKPKVPKAPLAPNPAITPTPVGADDYEEGLGPVSSSLISTAARGLTRRANVNRTSLLGGG